MAKKNYTKEQSLNSIVTTGFVSMGVSASLIIAGTSIVESFGDSGVTASTTCLCTALLATAFCTSKIMSRAKALKDRLEIERDPDAEIIADLYEGKKMTVETKIKDRMVNTIRKQQRAIESVSIYDGIDTIQCLEDSWNEVTGKINGLYMLDLITSQERAELMSDQQRIITKLNHVRMEVYDNDKKRSKDK